MPAQVDAVRRSGELRPRRPSARFLPRAERIASRELVVEGLRARLRIDVGAEGSAIRTQGEIGDARVERDAQGRVRVLPATDATLIEFAITVPTGAAVALNGVTGAVTIGDTRGPLALRLQDGCEVRAGCVTGADVRIDGDSRVTIAEITGDMLEVDVTGRGRVQAGGEVRRFASTVQGAGDVLLRGCADEAQLTVEGSGHIGVTRVRRGLASSCVGSGGIAVACPPSPVMDRSAVIFDGISAALAGR